MFRLIAICVAIALIQTAHADTISNASSTAAVKSFLMTHPGFGVSGSVCASGNLVLVANGSGSAVNCTRDIPCTADCSTLGKNYVIIGGGCNCPNRPSAIAQSTLVGSDLDVNGLLNAPSTKPTTQYCACNIGMGGGGGGGGGDHGEDPNEPAGSSDDENKEDTTVLPGFAVAYCCDTSTKWWQL